MLEGINYLNSLEMWKGSSKFDIHTTRKIVEYLGNPQDKVNSIHVAGTNGKGSTSAMIAGILGATGLKVGLNTSPHLSDILERFIIDGSKININQLDTFAIRLKTVSEELGIKCSYHEAVTICSFLLFSNLDWAVFEVGLGGRADASNVLLLPKISIITNISYDHQNVLGFTLEEIAREKAGIIKEKGRLILGDLEKAALNEILTIAKERSAHTCILGRDFSIEELSNDCVVYKDDSQEITITPSLKGRHQLNNLAIAIKAGLSVGVNPEECKFGVEHLYWPGRLENIVYQNKNVWIDCAHNIGGIRALKENFKKNADNQLIILGLLQRPDWQEIIQEVAFTWKNIIVLTPQSDRAIPSKILYSELSSSGVNVLDFDSDYSMAIRHAVSANQKELLIFGSIYLIGAIREELKIPDKPIWTKQTR